MSDASGTGRRNCFPATNRTDPFTTRMDIFKEILKKVNTPCTDDGRSFVESERLDNITDILKKSDYFLLKEDRLSYVYQHKKHEKDRQCLLISCHVDSVYSKYHLSDYGETEILGTFDNSICNAALIYLMIEDKLPANVLVAFTGDEERECRGAKETMEFVRERYDRLWQNLELTIVLDITSEGYDSFPFTIENYFTGDKKDQDQRLQFSSNQELRDYLQGKLTTYANVKFIGEDADPDETWEYIKFGQGCFTFCFPARPHPDNEKTDAGYWMHSDKGMLIKKESTAKYPDALSTLLNGIMDDLVR
jgi:hypothetical protein